MGAISPAVERVLHPPAGPFAAGMLDVGDGHALYHEQCGRPDGVPILFVHGGPGAGCALADRRFFDPERARAVLVDQRGCGRSTPHGSVAANTVDHLLADFERLREELGIERWHVFGGSWGSTLALAYAQAHPDRCLSLVLRGIWLFRQRDLHWWLEGMRVLWPERWEVFSAHVDRTGPEEILEAYWGLLDGPDEAAARAAAKVWSVYEGASCTLLPNAAATAGFEEPRAAWALARLEAHYFRTERFDPDDRLLRDLDGIRHIPCFMVHGRYDVVCPIEGAFALHERWPEADFAVVDGAGHASREPGTADHLVAACDRLLATGDPRRR